MPRWFHEAAPARPRRRPTSRLTTLLAAAAALCAPAADAAPAAAQSFGRNKVQYERFDFRVLRTEHLDVHYYPAEAAAARDAARMLERWYVRLSAMLEHEIEPWQPVILYADHPDFQQTNVVGGMIDESTGGITESSQRRVVLPLTPSYGETDHVLGHELVHAFQFHIAEQLADAGSGRLHALPLWMVEGMAEYLAGGRADPNTALWLRDAVLHDDVPTLETLGHDPRYFPYRFGQAVWAYIGGRFGDRRVGELYRETLRHGWELAVDTLLGVSADSLSADWVAAVHEQYAPLLVGRTHPDSLGRPLAAGRAGPTEMMIAPAASPDGSMVAFLWAREFSIDLYLADGRTGEVLKQVASAGASAHIDALSFMGSAGAWSPDGRKLAIVVFARGDNELAIVDVASGGIERRFAVPGVGAVATPAWSPDGGSIAFSGTAGGLSDLYLLDLGSGAVRRLTADRHADLQPAWSPDGRTLAFVTDRAEDGGFERLEHASMRIALYDLESAELRVLPLLPAGHHINPQFTPDGRALYFLGAPDGFRDLYVADLESGAIRRLTRLATGITGLTALSPALSVAQASGDVFASVFDRRGHHIRALGPLAGAGEAVAYAPARSAGQLAAAGTLPPADARGDVERYLADAAGGLPDPATFADRGYSPRPRLSYFGLPVLGLSVDRYGTGVFANAQAFFTDVLGGHGLAVQGLVNGGWREVGGQAFYESRSGRWNWGIGAGHIPVVIRAFAEQSVPDDGQGGARFVVNELRQRLTLDQGYVAARYPLSATRRVELSGGAARVGYGYELVTRVEVGGDLVDRGVRRLPAPDAAVYWQAAAAFVGDNAVFGIASPVRGERFRFELRPTLGTFDFVAALADWRRYVYRRPFTLALRGMHYGRYGGGAESRELGPLFIGADALVRGYNYDSFRAADCTAPGAGPTGCAELDRLFGSRIAVANLELRMPLIGTEWFGLLRLGYLPTELAAFLDAGVAWTRDEGPTLAARQRPGSRSPVASTGVSARFNVFGALILEAYYAYPFQRATGGRFGLQVAPGW